jgi:hypothetical protein
MTVPRSGKTMQDENRRYLLAQQRHHVVQRLGGFDRSFEFLLKFRVHGSFFQYDLVASNAA